MKKNFWIWTKEYYTHLKYSIKNSFLLGFLWKLLKTQLIFKIFSLLIIVATFIIFIGFNPNFFINKESFFMFLQNPLFIKTRITVQIIYLTTTITFGFLLYKSMAKFKFQKVSLIKAFVILLWFPTMIKNNILGFLRDTLGFFNHSEKHLHVVNNPMNTPNIPSVKNILNESWLIKIVSLANSLVEIAVLILIYKLYKKLKKENSQLYS